MSNVTTKHYPDVAPNPDFVSLEQDVLSYWKEQGVFEASIDNRAETVDGEANKFVFYDGPPFANGLPHYGHLLTGYVKDMVARYQTMRGHKTPRRFGWDCHGLPAEMGAEKELKISGRQAITEFGIDKFNSHCQTSVMKYAVDWEAYVDRQARWVDFEDDYKTMDINFMESVIWGFKQLHEKGLVYESFRVMPYSWAAETPLSNFETKLDNSYREREDKAVTVSFVLDEAPKSAPKANAYNLLAWTTTPWTLPSNLALAASSAMSYLPVMKGDECYIVGMSAVSSYRKELFAEGQYETERCILRPFTEDDADLLISLHTNEEVMDTVNDGLQTEEEARAHLKTFIEGNAKDGYSQWAVFHKETGTFMGHAGLQKMVQKQGSKDPAKPVLRCVLFSEFWGGGYGSELCKYSTMLGFTLFGAEEIIAGAVDHNPKAHKMIEKVGYEFVETVQFKNHPGPYYTINREQFIAANAILGEELIGQSYVPLFPYFSELKEEGAFRVLDGSSFIEDGSGTGVVHMAPGFGEDDQRVCAENGIEVTCPVDGQGKYTDDIFDLDGEFPLKLQGLNVIAQTEGQCEAEPYKPEQLAKYGLANLRIINWLKLTGKLFKQEDYKHNYPHCWRTDTPIIYKAMASWYVEVTKFRDRAVELNQQINWIPSHIRDGSMGHMLKTAPDWSISRNRFWGCPIPIWRSDNPANDELYVFGSVAELQEFFGVEVDDLHRPFIDTLTKPDPTNPDYTLRRVADVFDCWFESGSMPFAQLHYPFENKEVFEANFPADFITEYIGQTRGWFNTLIMLSTALFDKPPFKNCICHGVVLDEETGLKYSKRLKNYKDPMEVFDKFGSDALRWMMLASPVMRGADIGVDPDGRFIRDVVRLHIKPVWNAYNFFSMYANADGAKAEFSLNSENVMDQYILMKSAEMTSAVRTAMDAYDAPSACNAISGFLEVLNNWYIRRNRERFWKETKDADKQSAYNTLYTVLHVLCRAASPLLPLVTEQVFLGLTAADASARDAQDSVHVQNFPDEMDSLVIVGGDELLRDMDRVREMCNAAHGIRNSENIRIRQPLAGLTIYKAGLSDANSEYFASLIADESNVKGVNFSDALDEVASLSLKINFPVAGKRLGAKMKSIAGAAKQGQWERNASGDIAIGEEILLPDEYEMTLQPLKNVKAAQALSSQDSLVVMDTELTAELLSEGIARDVVRMVQQARKDAGLEVSDRIGLVIATQGSVEDAVQQHKSYIAQQVLASNLDVGAPSGDVLFSCEQALEGEVITLNLTKAA